MGRSFLLLCWGLVFVLADFHVNGFPVLPDFAGHALIAAGCHGLIQYTGAFQLARNLAAPLAILSLIALFAPPALLQILLILNPLLTLLLVWFLLGAVIRFTEARERPDLAGHAVLYRRIYTGIALFAFVFQQAARARPEAAEGFVGLAAVAMLVILFFIVRLLYVIKQDVTATSALA